MYTLRKIPVFVLHYCPAMNLAWNFCTVLHAFLIQGTTYVGYFYNTLARVFTWIIVCNNFVSEHSALKKQLAHALTCCMQNDNSTSISISSTDKEDSSCGQLLSNQACISLCLGNWSKICTVYSYNKPANFLILCNLYK